MPRVNRRQFLRGLFAGSTVSLALPFLPSAHRAAWANETNFPKRYVQFFWGNGILPERWIPATTGADFTLSDQLAPLEAFRSELTVLSGYEVKVLNESAHFSGAAGLFTGQGAQSVGDDFTFAGPSLDQQIAASLGDDTPFRSLEIGVQPGLSGLSFNGPGSKNPPSSDPVELFQRLFGPSFREPGEAGVVDPKLALRRSILDSVLGDAQALQARLGTADRQRLDQHLSAVRDLERRIARLEEDPPNFAGCYRPEAPGALPDIDGRPQMAERARVMADLTAMALACDLTRVASFWFSDPLSDVLYPGATSGHHQLTHDEPGDQPQVHDIMLQTMGGLADLLTSLQGIEEGGETLLDHAVVLATTDVSFGRTHQIDEFPLLLAGRASGALRPAGHLRTDTKDTASKVPLTVLRALDLPVASYGVDDAYTEGEISEVLS